MSTKPKLQWWKSITSFLIVLCTMPLGHAAMILMEKLLPHSLLPTLAFLLGFLGFVMVVIGVFASTDTKQTLWGFFGGLLFWTGWVEFLFQYYANRYGTLPEIVNGEIVTKPEYLILPATFGFWMMFMMLYIFSVRTGCNFLNWLQKIFFRDKKPRIVARPMTRHTSIVTFMELNMILWTSYLLLMFCYDPRFIGDHSPITFAIGIICFIASFFIFAKQLRLSSWGANIRMSIATVIVFWTPVEILGRVNFFNEFWVQPLEHIKELSVILVAFIALVGYFIYVSKKRKPDTNSESVL